MWKAGGNTWKAGTVTGGKRAGQQGRLKEPTGPTVVAREADGSREDVGRGRRCAAGAEEGRRDPMEAGGDLQRRRRD